MYTVCKWGTGLQSSSFDMRGCGFPLLPRFDLDDVCLLPHSVTPKQPDEPPPDGGSSVEDDPRAEDTVEDVDDGVPDESPGAVVILLALAEVISGYRGPVSHLVDEEGLDGGVDEEDDGGDDPHVGRYKVLLPLLPAVAGIQCWGSCTLMNWSDSSHLPELLEVCCLRNL